MSGRLEIHEILKSIAQNNNVYYQPPGEALRVKYPAIIYSISSIDLFKANNKVYLKAPNYKVTVIDFDPESPIVDRLTNLPEIKYLTHFCKDGLNHFVFNYYKPRKL